MVSERGIGKNLEGNAHSPVYEAFSWKNDEDNNFLP
jgi:hypothetical protein